MRRCSIHHARAPFQNIRNISPRLPPRAQNLRAAMPGRGCPPSSVRGRRAPRKQALRGTMRQHCDENGSKRNHTKTAQTTFECDSCSAMLSEYQAVRPPARLLEARSCRLHHLRSPAETLARNPTQPNGAPAAFHREQSNRLCHGTKLAQYISIELHVLAPM